MIDLINALANTQKFLQLMNTIITLDIVMLGQGPNFVSRSTTRFTYIVKHSVEKI